MASLLLTFARAFNRLIGPGKSPEKAEKTESIEGGPDQWIGTLGQGVLIVPGWRILEHEPFASTEKALQKAFGNPAEYRRYLRPIIERFADFVQLVPASRNSHHSDYGGLLLHCLEVAVNALNEIKELDKVLPPGGRLADHEIAAFAPQVRTLIATYAIGHDLAKITTAMRITIFSDAAPKQGVVYDHAPDNQPFSASLYEAGCSFARHNERSPNTIRCRWSWVSGPLRSQHDRKAHLSSACLALLSGSKHKFPDLLIAFYLPGCVDIALHDSRFPPHIIQDHHFNVIAPLINRADKKSASRVEERRHADPRSESSQSTVIRALRHGAALGIFTSCPLVRGRMFVDTGVLLKLMDVLHEHEEFSVLPYGPNFVDDFAAHLQPHSVAPPDDSSDQPQRRFYRYNGERGLFFNESCTAMILGYQSVSRPDKEVQDSDATEEDPSPTVAQTESQSSNTDISAHGAAVLPPPIENEEPFAGSDVFTSQATPIYHSFDEIDDNETKIVLVISAFLETLTLEDCQAGKFDVSINDSRLTLNPKLVLSIAKGCRSFQLGPFSSVESAAAKYTRSHWRVIRDNGGHLTIVCGKAYTKAIFDNDPDNPLLIVRGRYDGPALRPLLEKTPQKMKRSPPSSPCASQANPSTTGTDSVPEPNVPSLKTLFEYLRHKTHDDSCQEPPRWYVENHQLVVSQALIDTYTGNPSRRGQVMDMLRNAGIAVTRSSNTQRWTLTFTTDEAKKWLNE